MRAAEGKTISHRFIRAKKTSCSPACIPLEYSPTFIKRRARLGNKEWVSSFSSYFFESLKNVNTYVQSWLKLTKKTPLGGSAVWFVRFMRPDMPYFNPCVNTSTLRARFCINRTYGARTNAPLRLLTLLDSLFCLPHAFALSLLFAFSPSHSFPLSLLLSLSLSTRCFFLLHKHTRTRVYIIGNNDQVVLDFERFLQVTVPLFHIEQLTLAAKSMRWRNNRIAVPHSICSVLP